MQLSILTLFPEYFEGPFGVSMLKRAQESGASQISIINIRDFATDKHKVTDDRPYGGGAGMVLKVEPIDLALQSLNVQGTRHKVVLTSAKGSLFTQQTAQSYAQLDHLVIICGHYEGVDERVALHLADEEIRIGDYVLTGGEPAAAVISDAVVRLLPAVLGNPESLENESHEVPGQIGVPQYTRPEEYRSWGVPEVLLSGNHKHIDDWRAAQQTPTDQSNES